jgi:hypothetical protein
VDAKAVTLGGLSKSREQLLANDSYDSCVSSGYQSRQCFSNCYFRYAKMLPFPTERQRPDRRIYQHVWRLALERSL